MNYRKQYTTYSRNNTTTRRVLLILAAVIIAGGIFHAQYAWVSARADEQLATCWIMCKPGSYVTIRSTPGKNGQVNGYLDSGDSFQTDGESKDGWISCCSGEGGWVYCGYVVTEKPQIVGERYICAAKKQVACRKWMGGPQIDGRPWLRNGEFVQVFLMADGWAITNRGYIRSEWLDVSPE